MGVKFQNYTYGYRIVSLALSESAKNELLEKGMSVLYVDGNRTLMLPDSILLSDETAVSEQVKTFNSFDVFSIWENGLLVRRYDDQSNDNYLFVTGRCNSNCVMCPSTERSRMQSTPANISDLIELARHIPSDATHLTITGGEPFLAGEEIFSLIRFLKEHFTYTEFLFLTNGRVFALDRYVELLKESLPCNSLIAIPLHGSCSEIHDYVTRTKGSFAQTVRGLRGLLRYDIPVEIRIVVSKLNVSDFDKIADLILSRFGGIEYVSVIAMEMTGAARANKEEVWISYKESFTAISGALRKLLNGGIDVKLYNFPICTVEKSFWALCEKSISPSKIKFGVECEKCRYRQSCSGVFSGTLQLEKGELKAIS